MLSYFLFLHFWDFNWFISNLTTFFRVTEKYILKLIYTKNCSLNVFKKNKRFCFFHIPREGIAHFEDSLISWIYRLFETSSLMMEQEQKCKRLFRPEVVLVHFGWCSSFGIHQKISFWLIGWRLESSPDTFYRFLNSASPACESPVLKM